ncbi:penicillin-binding protein activator LpoB [Yersinia alsatica]|uniref:Penicillin-binding protein activator LpoB n=1 Tax=Yersinia alsatica TaxID=2890317 RepID=A0ABY5UJ23_9GAMM|nr:penicillin-binding protein activator LpoB [Yersinia alsatica]OVZ91232.1 penicillin-binding protein activator LpoB [Yersinia frederiksenii]OWF69165.1 penicillin-binding protein activator LpoB [Yersinia frederiksenii]OWF83191.1 penicillin-binding protein activator LpoB [Yersinia frederiksenii]UWM43447.1 penicillin-binding protein activator LpoB [Yersinia alsatica]CFQ58853.1 putative lipoprotein [Yersinia frederiksenii]
MKRYLSVALAALVLTGCMTRAPTEPTTTPPVTIEPVTPPVIETPPPVDTVPQPPKMQQSIDWAGSVEPLVAQMVNSNDVANGSILLLDSVKNNTNGALQTAKATSALHQVLTSNKKFVLISPQQLAVAKQTLGLSEEDSLGSRSKAIGLARYVSAQYVLYSDVSGDVKSPTIEMQLMQAQTGEIIWSGNGPVKR